VWLTAPARVYVPDYVWNSDFTGNYALLSDETLCRVQRTANLNSDKWARRSRLIDLTSVKLEHQALILKVNRRSTDLRRKYIFAAVVGQNIAAGPAIFEPSAVLQEFFSLFFIFCPSVQVVGLYEISTLSHQRAARCL
jgi:hypothetical protein